MTRNSTVVPLQGKLRRLLKALPILFINLIYKEQSDYELPLYLCFWIKSTSPVKGCTKELGFMESDHRVINPPQLEYKAEHY